MSRKIAPTKKVAGPAKGSPQRSESDKSEVKEVYQVENLDEHFERSEKYTDGDGHPAENMRVNNPNRNYDKPDIDKPSYN
ncbi:MAG: hypothetical protein ACK4ND_06405 [Cytophagaceae bacterium]